MKMSLISVLTKLLRKTADDLDAGNSELSESEALDIMDTLCHTALSKAQAYTYLNTKRSNFDKLVRDGVLPKGRKRKGFKELVWYRDELDNTVRK
jgi:hypothetical protein